MGVLYWPALAWDLIPFPAPYSTELFSESVVAGHAYPGHPGGNNVTLFELSTVEWGAHELPVSEQLGWRQAGVLDATSGKLYILWTEVATPHTLAMAALYLARYDAPASERISGRSSGAGQSKRIGKDGPLPGKAHFRTVFAPR